MNYLLKNNRTRRSRKPLLGIFFGFLFFVFLIQWIFPSLFSSLFYFIGYPIWKGESNVIGVATGDTPLFSSRESLIAENAELKKQIEEIQNDLNELVLLREENEEMKKLLGRSVSERRIVAGVLTKPNFSPYDTLVLDIGSENGVLVGDRIVSGKSIVLGEIIETHPRFSKAKLYSSPGTEVNVMVGKDRVQTVATGRGVGNFEAKLPHGVFVSKGDTVIMPGVNPLLFATVEAIDVKDTDSFQTLFFKSPINISSLGWVEVVENSISDLEN